MDKPEKSMPKDCLRGPDFTVLCHSEHETLKLQEASNGDAKFSLDLIPLTAIEADECQEKLEMVILESNGSHLIFEGHTR